ncbi:hypothetical protein BK649_10680 [Pseudomonas canadensis]|uniref:Nucleoid-associated protein n=1 Tax=Pseudomonas canadensis TaxID=915099 RepID=A0A423FBU2_9PSED|nr:nucleoid-associated protein [Pseudomonas canadensis]ROM54077.1 hypothetical protein BK649_10680 [Pseudomonas canadensis]
MSIKIINALGAQLIPPQEEKPDSKWTYILGKDWPKKNKASIKFTNYVNTKFQKSSKTHGSFANSIDVKKFSNLLNSHLKNATTFRAFINDFMRTKLIIEVNSSRVSSGVIAVFLHYKLEPEEKDTPQQDYLIVLLIRNTDALKFDETLLPDSIDIINIEQLLQAARIDITKFSSSYPPKKDQHDNHVCFIRGSGDVRQYFITAMGAGDLVTNKKSSEQCITAITDFIKKFDLERSTAEKIDVTLNSLFEEKRKHHKPVTIEEIQEVIDDIIPRNKKLAKGAFVDFVNNGGYEINEEFEVPKKESDRLEWIELNTSVAKMTIHRHNIGTPDSGKPIIFDSETGEITVIQKIEDQKTLEKLESLISYD